MYRSQQTQNKQRALRQRRSERAFIFTSDLSRCLGAVDREDWEDAIDDNGGSVASAAADCGLSAVPRDAKALWGVSSEAAVGAYRAWLKRKAKR